MVLLLPSVPPSIVTEVSLSWSTATADAVRPPGVAAVTLIEVPLAVLIW